MAKEVPNCSNADKLRSAMNRKVAHFLRKLKLSKEKRQWINILQFSYGQNWLYNEKGL